MQPRQRPGQARCGGAFHGAQAQQARGLAGAHGLARFLGQGQQPVGIAAQDLARGRGLHALALAQEERHTQLFLELLHARGHVGLSAPEPLGGARHAAFRCHGVEDFQRHQVHFILFMR